MCYNNRMFDFSDLARNLTLSTNALQAKSEEIKRTNFDGLLALNGSGFNIAGFASGNAQGAIEITDTAYSDLKRVRLIACFKNHKCSIWILLDTLKLSSFW